MAAAGAPLRRPGDARNRAMSTELRLGHCTYLGDPWAILDCPGSVEFTFETACGLAVADIAVVVCEPTPSRAMTVAPVLKLLQDEGVPHLVFVNKIDTLDGGVGDTLAALQAYSKLPLVLRQVPIREGQSVSGYVDVVSERAYRYRRGQSSELIQLPSAMQEREKEALASLVEVLADHDDAILEKVLEDVTPSSEEIYAQLRKDLAAKAVVEVLLGAAEHDHGIRLSGRRFATKRRHPRKRPRAAGFSRMVSRCSRYSRRSMRATRANSPTPGSGAAPSKTVPC